MENLVGPGLEQGQLAVPLSPSSILRQSALENIAEFSALVLERRKPFLGKRIDIASDEVTGEQAAEILSKVAGYKIRYVPVPLNQVYQANEDMARMYEWYEKVGTGLPLKIGPNQNWDETLCSNNSKVHYTIPHGDDG